MTHSFDPTSIPTDLFIDGTWQKAANGATFTVENPATNEVIAHVADGSPEDAALAIHAAGRAQAEWSKSTPRQRADILRRAFDLVIANTDRLAAIMTAEMGKPLAEARGEVAYGAEMLRWFSEEAVRIGGDSTIRSAQARSAVVSVSTSGVWPTGMPRRVASSTSTLLNPTA